MASCQRSSRDIRAAWPGRRHRREACRDCRGIERWRLDAYNASIYESVLKVGIACEELLVEERGVLNISEECSVDGVAGRQVFKMDRLNSHGDRVVVTS